MSVKVVIKPEKAAAGFEPITSRSNCLKGPSQSKFEMRMMNLWWKNQKVDETNNLIFYSRPRQSFIYWSAQSTDSPILPRSVLKPIILQLILPKMTKHTIPISDEECYNSKGTGWPNWTCLRIKTFLFESWTMSDPSNSVAVIWFDPLHQKAT